MAAAVARLAEDEDGDPLSAARQLIAPRNVAGLADPAKRRLYSVDLQALVDAAPQLGFARDELSARLPRLRVP
jgi:hypothetical protein